MSEFSWRDKFTSNYLRVNLPSWNLSRRATYQSYLHWVKLPSKKFIENQSEHLSKLTLYHLKNVLQGDLDVLVNRAEFIIFMQSRFPLGPGKFHIVVLVSSKSSPVEPGSRKVKQGQRRRKWERIELRPSTPDRLSVIPSYLACKMLQVLPFTRKTRKFWLEKMKWYIPFHLKHFRNYRPSA